LRRTVLFVPAGIKSVDIRDATRAELRGSGEINVPHKSGHIIGVDIGGSKVAAGIVSSSGNVLANARARMVTDKGEHEGLSPVFTVIDKLLQKQNDISLLGIGVSVPGWVDSRRGVLLSATNVPCWKNYPLADAVQQRYRVPVRLANDAKAAILGEAIWGAASGYKNAFYVSLGTGIGTGIIIEGRLYYGRTGMAGEGGHMSIDSAGPMCGCGKRGCIEMYASGTAIGRRARQMLKEDPSRGSRLLGLVNGDIDAVSGEIVGQAVRLGDVLAITVLREAADALAIWLGNIIDLLEPEVIVLGGGLAQQMTESLNEIRHKLDTWAINPQQGQIPIVKAVYQAESGIVGAASLCLSRSRRWLSNWQEKSKVPRKTVARRVTR
jgi:glucokinase